MAQITVDTGMNTKPVLNSISELNRQVRSLRNYVRVAGKEMDVSVVGYAKAMRNNAIASREANDRVKELNATYQDLLRQIDELGNSRIDTKEYAELKKEIESAEKGLKNLYNAQKKLVDLGKSTAPSDEFKKNQKDLQGLYKKQAKLNADYNTANSQLQGAVFERTDARNRLNAEKARKNRLIDQRDIAISNNDYNVAKKIETQIAQSDKKIKQFSAELQTAEKAVDKYAAKLTLLEEKGMQVSEAISNLAAEQESLKKTGGDTQDSEAMRKNQYEIKKTTEYLQKLQKQEQDMKAAGKDTVSGDTTEKYGELIAKADAVEENVREAVKKAQDIKPLHIEQWNEMQTATKAVADALAKVQNAGNMAGYALRHPIEALDRALPVVVSGMANLARKALDTAVSFGKMAVNGVVNTVKRLASAAWEAATGLARMAGSAVVSFLQRLTNGAKNAALWLARVAATPIKAGLKKIGSLAASAGKAIFGIGKSARRSNNGLGQAVKMLVRYGFGVRSVFMLVRRLRSALVSAFQNMAKAVPEVNVAISKMAASLGMLKNSMATAFQPILSAVAPLITQLMDMLSAAMTKVGMFFATLTGQDYVYKATKAQYDYAKSLDKTKKSAKEAENQLASFDKLDILKANKDNGSDTDTNAADAGGFTKTPVLDSIKNFANQLKDLFKNGEFAQLGRELAEKINGFFKSIDFEEYGKKIGNIINKVVEFYNAFMEGIDWDAIGRKLADGLNGLLTSVDWEALGRAFSQKINAIFGTLSGFVNNTKWALLGQQLATAVWGFFGNIKWDLIGETIGTGISKVSLAIKNFALRFPWESLGEKVASGANKMFGSIKWTDVADALNASFRGVLRGMRKFIREFDWTYHGTALANGVRKFIKDLPVEELGEVLTGMVKGVIDFFTPMLEDEETWRTAGTKLATGLNKLFGDTEMWAGIGTTFNNLALCILEFANGALDDFKPDKAADAIKAALGEIQWGPIASKLWADFKLAISKAGSFVDALLNESVDPNKAAGSGGGAYVLALADFNKKSIGEKLGIRIREAFGAIPWGQIYEELKQAAQSAFKGIGDFLVAVLNVSPDELDAADGNKVKAIAVKIGTMMQTIGTEIGKLPWGEYLSAAWEVIKEVVKGFIDGLLSGEGDGSVLAWVLAAFVTLKTGLLGAIAKLILSVGSGMLASTPFLVGSIETMIAAVGAAAVLKIYSLGVELSNARKEMQEAFNNETDSGLKHYLELYQKYGAETANEYANTCYGLKLEGNNLYENLTAVGKGIAEQQHASFNSVDRDVALAKAAYETLAKTSVEDANEWANSTFNMNLASNNAAENAEAVSNTVSTLLTHGYTTLRTTIQNTCGDIIKEGSTTASSVQTDTETAASNIEKTVDESTKNVASTAKQNAPEIKESITNPIKESDEEYEELFSEMSAEADKAWNDITESSKTGGKQYNTAVTTSNEKAQTEATQHNQAMIGTFTSMFAGILASAATMVALNATVAVGMATMKTTITTTLTSITTEFNTTFSGIITTINGKNWSGVGSTIVNGIKNGITNNMSLVTAAVSTMAERAMSTVNGKNWYNSGYRVVEGIRNGINGNIAWICGMMSTMSNKMMTTITNLNWFGIGYQIVRGVREGIQANTAWISGAAEQMAWSAYRAACKRLGIASPSKLFRDGVGLMIGYGLAEGLEDSQPEVMSTVSDMATAMEEKMANENLQIGVDTTDAFDGFGDKIVDGFETLISRLQAIADSVTFRTPAVAAGTVLPYNVAAQAASAQSGLTDALVASNDDLASVVIQATNNAAMAIVNAIQRQGGNTGINDLMTQTSKIIDEINRRARMQGASPIIV